jgi:hypothetical protein
VTGTNAHSGILKLAIEALDAGVLRWFSLLNQLELCVMFIDH